MQDYQDHLGKICQCTSKPFLELAQLNIETLNNIMKNSLSYEELSHLKKPEDFLSAQLKVANTVFIEATKYSQSVMEIAREALLASSKIWSETVDKASNKVSEFTKHTGKHEKTS